MANIIPPTPGSTVSLADRVDEVRGHTLQVFGLASKAEKWMHRPNPALDGRLPEELLCTAEGVEAVDTILTRIEHGVYS